MFYPPLPTEIRTGSNGNHQSSGLFTFVPLLEQQGPSVLMLYAKLL